MKSLMLLAVLTVLSHAQEAEYLLIPFEEFTLRFDQMWNSPILDTDSIAKLDTLVFHQTGDGEDGIHGWASCYWLTIDMHDQVEVTIYERTTVGFFFNPRGTCGMVVVDSMPTVTHGFRELEQREGRFAKIIPEGEPYPPLELSPEAWETAEEYAEDHYTLSGADVYEDELETAYWIRVERPDGTVWEKYLIFLNRP